MAKSNAELIVQSAHQHITNINNCLRNIKSDVIVDFLQVSNDGVNIMMSKLASPSDLTTIEKYIKSINNIALDLIESLCLSKSKLYLKIIGLSYLIDNSIITPNFVEGVLKKTHLFKHVLFVKNRLATEPVTLKVRNVKLSFDIWLVLYMYFILYS